MKKKISVLLKYLPYVLILVLVSCIYNEQYAANDLYFDLKTGESILKYGIDFKDHFSWITGLTYIYHHWLYDLITYFIYKLFSWSGLYFFFLIFINIFSISYFFIINEKIKNKFLSCFFSLLVLSLMNNYFSTRVQTVSYPLFLLYFYLIDKLYKKGDKKYGIIAVVISLLILNLHMTMWIITVILLLPYIFEELVNLLQNKIKFIKQILNKYLNKRIIIEAPKNKKTFNVFSIILFFCGLITPLKLWAYRFSFTSIGIYTYKNVNEMKSTALIDIRLYLITLIVLTCILIFSKNKISLRKLCLYIGIFLMSLIAYRNVSYAFIILPLIIIDYIDFDKVTDYFKKINVKFFINKNVLQQIFSLVELVFIIVYMSSIDFKIFNYQEEIGYPTDTVKYIKENLDYKNSKFFTEYNYGSYYEFYDIPVFVDSRAEVFLKKFNNNENILVDYFNGTESYEGFEQMEQKYQFDYFLVSPYSELNYIMKKSSNYVLKYAGNLQNVYVKIN